MSQGLVCVESLIPNNTLVLLSSLCILQTTGKIEMTAPEAALTPATFSAPRSAQVEDRDT